MHIPLLSDLCDLLVPRRCHSCGDTLLPSERTLCLRCLASLPRLHDARPGNQAEAIVFGRLPFEHGASFCHYAKDTPFARLIQQAKYAGRPYVDGDLAACFARELEADGWPFDIDAVMPVPIHWLRRLGRGYNQSESIARAIGRHWQLPVYTHSLVKARYTRPQVGQSYAGRSTNVLGSFALRHPSQLPCRHVLLVDDVLTTGATLTACGDALAAAAGLRVSFLTLGLSG